MALISRNVCLWVQFASCSCWISTLAACPHSHFWNSSYPVNVPWVTEPQVLETLCAESWNTHFYLFIFVMSICFRGLCCLWLHLHALFCPPERCDDASLQCVVDNNEKSELVSLHFFQHCLWQPCWFTTAYSNVGKVWLLCAKFFFSAISPLLLMAYRQCKQT